MAKEKREKIDIRPDHALIIVDLQNDFCEGGALAVKGAGKIIPAINRLINTFRDNLVVASLDWHPSDHCSFKGQGGQWPPHCIYNTEGSNFNPNLKTRGIDLYFYKGLDKNCEVYSAFGGYIDMSGMKTLDFVLSDPNYNRANINIPIRRIFVTGLATDYCVKATVLDGLKLGYEVYVVTDAIAAVDANPGDGEKALREMVEAGAKLCKSKNIICPRD